MDFHERRSAFFSGKVVSLSDAESWTQIRQKGSQTHRDQPVNLARTHIPRPIGALTHPIGDGMHAVDPATLVFLEANGEQSKKLIPQWGQFTAISYAHSKQ